ncbi:hypothetical protein [Streptomyces sp. MJP52]|uniref:hypothetical protein n=1 Tax=Streptomyces sp. MJP52 TaxID=2940555 RepID=UPI0024738FF8|nr:hypothetical protein [Streptomyces sp. MJP52]MDH6228167.1 hypothetical protein [Streptomyces sp. MJP52]
MFKIDVDTVTDQVDDTVSLSIINDAQIGNRVFMTVHQSDEDAFTDETLVLAFDEEGLAKLERAVADARQGLAAAQKGGIVGLASWAEKRVGQGA